ncbi:hypothetical protein HGRIS_004893 [Hohenbuehelia grisea]|uniref:Uncharacterized protein n=1 Tax=Hohenbuehelia grisea TaxID=104357 RepID=A0ABR3JDC9_9AGAR
MFFKPLFIASHSAVFSFCLVDFQRLEDAVRARKALNGRNLLGSDVGAIRIGFAKVPVKNGQEGNGEADNQSPRRIPRALHVLLHGPRLRVHELVMVFLRKAHQRSSEHAPLPLPPLQILELSFGTMILNAFEYFLLR